MTKLKRPEYYILFVIGVSVLSLILSIVSLIGDNNSGRYRSFVSKDSTCVYIFDKKTSRLFLRGLFEGKAVCLDLGTVNQPLIPFIPDNPIPGGSFIPDKVQP